MSSNACLQFQVSLQGEAAIRGKIKIKMHVYCKQAGTQSNGPPLPRDAIPMPNLICE